MQRNGISRKEKDYLRIWRKSFIIAFVKKIVLRGRVTFFHRPVKGRRGEFPTGGDSPRPASAAELVQFQYRQYSLDERRSTVISHVDLFAPRVSMHPGLFMYRNMRRIIRKPKTASARQGSGRADAEPEKENQNMSDLFETAKENLQFLGVCLLIVIAIYAVAVVTERCIGKKAYGNGKVSAARRVAIVGMFSAISAVLMLFELPLWFAPGFYELDFSEIPVMICAFSMGPVAGVTAELCKVLLKLVIKGTSTAFVGDFANFVVGCTLVLPASILYYAKKSRKMAIAGLALGTVIMTIFGSSFNALYLIPKFSQLFGMPMEAIIGMGTAVNSHINSVWTLVLFAVVPFNILKGTIVSVVTVLLYKHISPLLKGNSR